MADLFFDLDNTLICTKDGSKFPDLNNWQFFQGVVGFLRQLSIDNSIYIISNQGGIDAGHKKLIDVQKHFELIYNELAIKNLKIAFCPDFKGEFAFVYDDSWSSHRSFSFSFRKPGIGFYHLFSNHDKQAFMIGDREEDRLFAVNAKIGFFDANFFFVNRPIILNKALIV